MFSWFFVWAVSAIFSDGICPVEWDEELGLFVRANGSVIRFRSEGWSDTRIGSHGLTRSGEAVLRSPEPKFILWGDSFADALQVDDSRRAVTLYNSMTTSMKGLTVAGGGLGISDYYFNIPRYEGLSGDIKGHVILLAGLEDVIPGRHIACHSRFLPAPWRFEESSCLPSELSLQYAAIASHWRLEPLYKLYRLAKQHHYRFSPGRVKEVSSAEESIPGDVDQAWAFLVKSLRSQTDGFVVFVYVPPVPALLDGRVVTRNSEAALMKRFRTICEAYGSGFVDLTRSYRDLYAVEGKLPRGFFNAPPTGHLNEDGQRLIAKALHAYFEERKQ